MTTITTTEPVTISGIYLCDDGKYRHIYVTSPGMSRIGAIVTEEEWEEITAKNQEQQTAFEQEQTRTEEEYWAEWAESQEEVIQ